MKPHEILSMLPQWAKATPDAILDSPAWAMPCRLGDAATFLRKADVKPCDTLDLVILLEGERHVLSLADTPRFADLHALWPVRAEVPEAILLALVEKECGVLLQLVENALRLQLKIEGIASDGLDPSALFVQVEDAVFGITRSPKVVSAFGQLRFIDCSHQSIRDETLPCETEYAAFTLPEPDLVSLAVGDALLLPEVGSAAPRLVADGRFAMDGEGVSPFKDDGNLRVIDAEARTVTMGEIFDWAQGSSGAAPGNPARLRLVSSGRDVAFGSFGQLVSQPAMIIESLA